MIVRTSQAVSLCALLVGAVLPPALGRTNFVSLAGSHQAPYTNWVTAATNIQAAIDVCALNGDTVMVNTGKFTVASSIAVDINVTVVSVSGPTRTSVCRAGPAQYNVFWIASTGAVVEGFTITNGATSYPTFGGGVFCAGGTLKNCIVAGNSGAHGAGIYLAYPPAMADRCVVRGNTAAGDTGGGIYCASGTVARSCEISANYASDGGGIVLESGALAENCTVVANLAGKGGGLIASNATIRNCVIYTNTAFLMAPNWLFTGLPTVQFSCSSPALTGGANCITGNPQFVNGALADYRLSKTSPCRNTGTNLSWMASASDLDGMPRVAEGQPDMGAYELSSFHYLSPNGLEIWPYMTLAGAARSIHDVVGVASPEDTILVDGGTYGVTNQILVDRPLTLLSLNGAAGAILQGDGGAHRLFTLRHPASVIDGLTLADGNSDGAGGAVAIENGGTVQNCIISNNTAAADGGGLSISTNGGMVRSCYFIGNRAWGAGGGIAASGAGAVVRSCALTINSAFNGFGGGVYTLGGAVVENCTMVGNFGNSGPGLFCSGNGAVVRNSIIYANNFVTYVNWGTNGIATFDHCYSQPLMPGSGNATNNPQIYHDTRTFGWDFHLRPDSPCLNSGVNQAWMADGLDADGYPRLTDGTVDIGAYERSPHHYYSLSGTPVWPYLSWASAATNIQSAIAAAQLDDTVWVTNGTHTFPAAVLIDNPVTLRSANGAGVTAIDGQNVRRCVTLSNSNAVLNGFTLMRGASETGGAVYSERGSVLNCTVISNTSSWGGGGVFLMWDGLVSNCTVKANQAAYYGAGVYCRLGGTVRNCVIQNNGTVSLEKGGGVYCHSAGTVANCTVIDNRASEGAAIYMEGGGEIIGGVVTNNITHDEVGAIHVYQSGRVTGTVVTGNDGGGVFLQGGGVVSNCILRGNHADFPGAGGAYVYQGGTVTVCTVSGNSGDQAAGVCLDGGGVLENSTVVSNSADNTGGGVWVSGGAALNCLVAGNTAAGTGGGVICQSGGLLRNCIVARNRADNSVGGVAAASGSVVQNCTIVSNTAVSDTGGLLSLAGVTIQNTIVRFNSAPSLPEYQDAGADWSFCAVAPAVAGPGNMTNDPVLVTQAGGRFGLSVRSPCIDAGTNMEWMLNGTDIRGAPRVSRGRVDIGAYETGCRYVALAGGNKSPFLSWADAATNIQSALDISSDGDTLLVSNGAYFVSAPISVTNRVALRSVGGAGATSLRHSGGNSFRVVSLTGADAVLDGFTVTNGLSSDIGGGVYAAMNGLVQNCVIVGNTASSYGGGVFMGGAGGVIQNCVIKGNRAQTQDGGGAYLSGGTVMRNCLVITNTGNNGGGIFAYQGATVDCSTVAANIGSSGGGIHCFPSGALVRNSIIFFNSAGAGPNWSVNGSADFRYSCTTPEKAGSTACTTADPLFTDLAARDFRLLAASPCRDHGMNASWMERTWDLEGAPRILDGTADMGAYETTLTHYVSTAGTNLWPFATLAGAATNLQSAIDAAGCDDEVRVAEGTYALPATVTVPRRLAIRPLSGAVTVQGGGIRRCFELTGDAVIEGLTIAGGKADVGGGLYIAATNTTLMSCVIENNCGDSYGGGIFYAAAGGLMDHCVVRGNTAPGNQGGGVYARGGVLLRNCLIHGNTSREGAGLFLCEGGVAENCTIVTNQASWLTGGVRFYNGGSVRNSIVYFNLAPQPLPNASIHNSGSMTYSCTWPAMAGEGNISAAPGFEGAASFRPVAGSPVIDSAAYLDWVNTSVDLDGMPRCIGQFPDMGAYENSPFHYVRPDGQSVWPYLGWDSATKSIADAAAVARMGDTVSVGSGVYALSGEVLLTQPIRVVGVSGRDVTVLDGKSKVRCVNLDGPAVIEELSLTGGVADEGGGVYCRNGGIVRQCKIYGNAAHEQGGGGYVLLGGTITDCIVTNNTVSGDGGGLSAAKQGRVENCQLRSNHATKNGGGVALVKEALALNCVMDGNEAGQQGGGAYLENGYLNSCTAVGNSGYDAGGVFAAAQSVVSNTIVQFNAAVLGQNVSASDEGQWFYCCTLPLMGMNGIEDAPVFVAPEQGDYRLAPGCVCIDSGCPGPSADLNGLMRPLDGDANGWASWDMGAFEFLNPGADSDGDGMFDGWEMAHFGSPTNGVSLRDDDGDHVVNLDEFVADTDPHDSASLFEILVISNRPIRGVGLASSVQRNYSLFGTTNLLSGGWIVVPPSVDCRGSGGLLFLPDTNDLPARFYRVTVTLP